jgi:DNA-binding CsgD family transcriptional regulator
MQDSALNTGYGAPAPDARRAERQRMLALMDDVQLGRAWVVELVGDPGSGKTRMLNDLATAAASRGMRVLRAQCGESNPDMLLDVLEQAADRRNASPAAAWGPDLVRATLELVERQPLVLLADDFHWAGRDCAELVDYLVRRPLKVPLLLVVAHRPRQTAPWLRASFEQCIGLGTLQRVELGPLTLVESGHILGLEPGDEHLRDLHAGSGGNPHYLHALAAIGDDRASSGAGLPHDPIVGQFATRVLGEVASLGAVERAVADAAAALGGEFDLETLAAVAGIGYSATCDAAVVLTRRDLLRPTADPGRLTLRHRVLGRVLYENIQVCSRELAHRRAADFLAARNAPAAARAAHLEFCVRQGDLEGIRVMALAAAQTASGDPEAAARWCHAALRALRAERDSVDERAALTVLLARTLGGLGGLNESRDILHDLLRMHPRPSQERGAAVLPCVVLEYLLGHRAEARAMLAREAQNAELYPPGIGARLIHEYTFLSAAVSGQVDADLLDRSLRFAREGADEVTTLGALLVSALYETLGGDIDKAGSLLDDCARGFDGLPDAVLSELLLLVMALAWLETYTARFADAERHLRRAIAVAEGCGNLSMVPFILHAMIYVDLHVGPLKGVQGKDWRACPLGEEHMDDIRMATLALQSTALLWGDGDDESRALRLAEESLDATAGPQCSKVGSTLVLASVSKAAGHASRCLSLVLAVGGGPELPHIPSLLRPMCFEMLCYAAALSGSPAAEDWAARAGAAARKMPLPHQRAYALAARGHLARWRGDHRGAARVYTRAADLFGSVHMTRVRAMTLLLAASCLDEAGEFTDADTLYVLVGVLGRECGASRFGGDAGQQRLRARERRLPGPDLAEGRRGLAALTNRECEIAVAASTGKRTREIAAELNLSPRTVEVHLTRIYRKLGLTSRAALAKLITELNITTAQRPA